MNILDVEKPAIVAAKTTGDMIKVGLADPAVGEALTLAFSNDAPKALLASRTPWGVLAGAIVGWGATKLGLACGVAMTDGNCLTPDTINLIGGFAAMGGAFVASYAMRALTKRPIGGVVSSGAAPA